MRGILGLFLEVPASSGHLRSCYNRTPALARPLSPSLPVPLSCYVACLRHQTAHTSLSNAALLCAGRHTTTWRHHKRTIYRFRLQHAHTGSFGANAVGFILRVDESDSDLIQPAGQPANARKHSHCISAINQLCRTTYIAQGVAVVRGGRAAPTYIVQGARGKG